MVRLARLMARHAFGLGMAIGTLLVPSLAVARGPSPGQSPGGVVIPSTPVQYCDEAKFFDDPTGVDAKEWCEFVSYSRHVWSTIIGGGGGDAPLYYRTSEPITGNGQYVAFDADGKAITVNVLACVSDDPTVAFGADDSSGILFAMLDGPSGSIGVEALVNTVIIETGELVSHVTPVDNLPSEMEEWLLAGGGFEQAAIIHAGCLHQAAKVFAAIMAAYAAAYAACLLAARLALNTLIKACARGLFIPKIGIALAVLCVGAAWAAYAIKKRACRSILTRGAEAAAAGALAAYIACMNPVVVPAGAVPAEH